MYILGPHTLNGYQTLSKSKLSIIEIICSILHPRFFVALCMFHSTFCSHNSKATILSFIYLGVSTLELFLAEKEVKSL